VTLRLGYAGCGFMAQKVHIPNIVGMEGLDLVALAEPRADVRERVAARYGVGRTYGSHRGLADDPEVEAVVVSGHYSGQGAIAADLLAAGKHVLVEKPLATSVAQAESILRAEAAGGARLMVAYMKRYDPGYEIVRELLHDPAERERLGDVLHVRFHAFDGGEWIAGLDTPFVESAEPLPPAPEHWPDWLEPEHRTPYVLYLQQYTHDVNLLRWLFDADRAVVDHVDLDADGFTGIVVLRVAGHRAVLETAMAESVDNDEQLQIYFERGWLRASSRPVLLRNQPVRVEVSRTTARGGERTEITPAAWRWAYVEELRHFAQALASGEPFRSSGADTLADVEAFEAIFRRWQASRPHLNVT
jgi:predicted dehydrogenase